MSFVDEFTRYVWIFHLINKSEVFYVFQKFYNLVVNQVCYNNKCLQIDGGG